MKKMTMESNVSEIVSALLLPFLFFFIIVVVVIDSIIGVAFVVADAAVGARCRCRLL